jgi:hypothetical protein
LVSVPSALPERPSRIPTARDVAITAARRPTPAMVADCVSQHPGTWMSCLVKADPYFGRFALSALALPGSRNAGTYNLDPESFDTEASSACTSFTTHDAKLGPEFARWSQTQDETITEQLDQGIRFVDLQVAYNGNGSATEGWRVVSSLYSDYPLYDYLDQIAIWFGVLTLTSWPAGQDGGRPHRPQFPWTLGPAKSAGRAGRSGPSLGRTPSSRSVRCRDFRSRSERVHIGTSAPV